MYQKLCSLQFQTWTEAQTIWQLSSGQLTAEEIISLIELYSQRRLQEIYFNSQDFFRDLEGYLQYYDPLGKADPQKNPYPLTQEQRAQLLKKYGYTAAINCAQRGAKKMAYRLQNKIIRFYYSSPQEFFQEKLHGVSEADIIQRLANNLLTVMAKNVAGAPFDLVERALPLTEIIGHLAQLGERSLIDQINSVKNPLITDFIEDTTKNIGLVVRLDPQGNKKVYLVAFDLDLKVRLLTRESQERVVERLIQQCFDLKPQSLDYNQLVPFIPQLGQLLPLPMTTRLAD